SAAGARTKSRTPRHDAVGRSRLPRLRRCRPGVMAVGFEGVTKRYGRQAPALDDVTWSLRRGARACLLGPNGAGKSTSIRLLQGAGALRPGATPRHDAGATLRRLPAAGLARRRAAGRARIAPAR